MGSLLARAYKRILSGKLAQDAGEHWVTVNAGSKEGGEGGGSHVLLDGEGRVVAGMGGKFKGQNIDRIERKKFINSNAWNRQRKALTEKAGDDTDLKRAVTAGMRSQAEKEADTSNDKWQKEGLYNALTRKTQRENKGIINVLHDYVDRMNAKPKTPNPIAEKIQKQSDGVKQIVTEAITKYNDLEAVNQLRDIPDGVNVVTEKGQFFKTGDLWSSPDGKKTLEHDQMFRQLKKELKGQISNKDMDNLMTNELEKVQYKDVAERVKDIDPQLAKEIENTEKKYNKLKAENIAKSERSEHEKKRGGGHAISFEEQNTEKKLQELKAQAESKIAEGKQEAPKADRKSLIDQVNARHTMPMGDIIARKEQAITDKINNSNLSEADKKKYLDKLNNLTDEALKAGAGSLDLYKVGVSYKKTNAESNAFNKMFSKQSEIDNLEKEINKKVQDNVTQAENKNTLNSLNEAERTGAVYFKDANGKEFYRANSKSKTWYQIDQYNQAKGEKAKAKQEALNAKKQQATPKAEEQPRDMKNAFSDKYQKIDNSNLNKYQKVDNISNNKNTENGVTNMNTNQESQATPKTDATTSMGIKDYEGKANINPRVATYIEDMGLKLSKDQYDKIATDYPPGNRSGGALALAGRDMRALQAFTKEYAKEISNTIADQEAAFEDMGGYHDFKGGSITISKKGDYLGNTQHASISFAGKPSEETRSLLKKNGFTYNPRYKTWENTARLGANKHEKILQTLKDGVTIESTQQATPTAQPIQATPTQQAEGKQYHGTGIENKNGRFEVSFNAFPSYELRTDMKNNGFKWDPNAKVWHTTDREKLDQVMSKHFTERT